MAAELVPDLESPARGAGEWRLVLALVPEPPALPAPKPEAAVVDPTAPTTGQTSEPFTTAAKVGRRLDQRYDLFNLLPVLAALPSPVAEPDALLDERDLDRAGLSMRTNCGK